MPNIEMQAVDSTAISERGYDQESLTLRVRFAPNKTNPAGAVYDYETVPLTVWEDWLRAPSAGSYWHTRIKNAFTARRVA